MKNILVTGGFGILGHTLSKKLNNKKHRIFIIDKKKFSNNYKKLNIPKKVKIFRIDFCNYNKIFNFIKKYKINIIFHLGASTQVIESYKNPKATFKNNIIGTINILEAVRILNKNIKVIFSSSDKAYGDLKKKKYKESDKIQGKFTYDVSKSSADMIAQTYNKTYKLNIAILRSGNIYGPGDFNINRIIPNLIINTLNYKNIHLRSNGKLRRDYIYVDDVVIAYHKVMKRLNKKNNLLIYNLGSKENLNAIEIVKKVYKILNIKNLKPKILNNTTNIELKRQNLDYSKINKELKWEPLVNFTAGIKKTIEWYKENKSLFK